MKELPPPKGTPAPQLDIDKIATQRNPEWAKYADRANRKSTYDFSLSREDRRKEAAVKERVIFSQ